jgi:predicted TIM-barrel fold metal-dependent hydrolase
MTALETGLFDGIKLHELEGHWVEKRPSALRRVLRIAQERGLLVQFHSGPDEFCSPRVLAKFAKEFSSVRFDFAHCCPMDEMAEVVAACPNVWTDTAFMDAADLCELLRYDWHGRLMFGSDLPVWQAHETTPLTKRLRSRLSAFCATGLECASDSAFATFVQNQV